MKVRFLFLCLAIFCPWAGLFAQNAPITTAATVGGAVPGTVSVTITVTGFTNIGAVSLSLDYDYSVLHFVSGTPNSQLANFAVGDNDLATGYHRVVMGWFGSGTSLPDGATIMTLNFTFINGITALTWYDIGPSCEYADAFYEVLNDTPTETYYINGFVCGAIGSPGAISGENAVCPGEEGLIYSVSPVVNATGYLWTVPGGALIVNGSNTNIITVNYSGTAVSGNVTVSGFNSCGSGAVSQLGVTVNPLPIADAGADFSIPYGTSTTLNAASGGSGSFTYHWSPEELLVDPDVQNPQTVQLTSTVVFTLVVTNQATLCQQSDEVTVTVTGGPLNANPAAMPAALCRGESAQLYANASGGSEVYSYFWTCNPQDDPPWNSTEANPLVTPLLPKHYIVMVNDGFNVVYDSVSLAVDALPTATITGGDTLCGSDDITTLPVDLTGMPPWSFTYTYGSTSVYVTGQMTSPYYIIASETGDYVISSVEDLHCSGLAFGTAIVRKYPIPARPEITVYFQELISSSCCGNRWYLNGQEIPGATGQTYQVQVSGLYNVVVTLNGCSSELSDTMDMIVGVPENDLRSVNIYPNPANDKIRITSAGSFKGPVEVRLYSPAGKIAGEYSILPDGNSITLETTGLAPGLYFLLLRDDGEFYRGKFIIQK